MNIVGPRLWHVEYIGKLVIHLMKCLTADINYIIRFCREQSWKEKQEQKKMPKYNIRMDTSTSAALAVMHMRF